MSLFSKISALLKIDDTKIQGELNRIKIFKSISHGEKKIVAKYLMHRKFVTEEEIYCESKPSVSAYFVLRGSVGLFKNTDDRRHRIKLLTAGDGFGLAAFVPETAHRESAVALEPCSLLALPVSDFERLKELYPKLANTIISNVLKYLLEEFDQMQEDHLALTAKLAKAQIIV